MLVGCEGAVPSGSGSVLKAQSQMELQEVESADDPIVAWVNGKPIRKSEVAQILWQGRGRRILDELIVLEAVRQRARQKQITSSEDLIDQEWDRILQDMAPHQTPREQLALLDYMLENRGMTRAEFDLIVRRQALLRRLVDPNVAIDEEMIAQEFERQHGRKVEVRVLLVSSLRRIEQAQKRLAAGESFAEVVSQMSEDEATLSRGGLWGPFTQNDEQIPPALREAAFRLEKVGQRGQIIRYFDKGADHEWWGLVELTQVIPADEMEMTKVRGELEAILKERQIRRRMLQLQQELQLKTKVEIVDPILRQKGKNQAAG